MTTITVNTNLEKIACIKQHRSPLEIPGGIYKSSRRIYKSSDSTKSASWSWIALCSIFIDLDWIGWFLSSSCIRRAFKTSDSSSRFSLDDDEREVLEINKKIEYMKFSLNTGSNNNYNHEDYPSARYSGLLCITVRRDTGLYFNNSRQSMVLLVTITIKLANI